MIKIVWQTQSRILNEIRLGVKWPNSQRPTPDAGSPTCCPQAAQALFENHTEEHNLHVYKDLYGIFYKISTKIVKVKILNKNGLPCSILVLFAPGVVTLPISLDLRHFFRIMVFYHIKRRQVVK